MNNNECHPFLSLSLARTSASIVIISYLWHSELSTILPPFFLPLLPPFLLPLLLPFFLSLLMSHPVDGLTPPPSCDSLAFNFDEKSFRFLLSNFFWQNCTRPAKVFLRYFGSRDRVTASRSLASIPPPLPSSCFFSLARNRSKKRAMLTSDT